MTAARRDAPLWRQIVNENRRVAAFDAVVGIEDGGVDNGPESLTRGIRRIGRNQGVDEDLVPLQHLVGVLVRRLSRRGGRAEGHEREQGRQGEKYHTGFGSVATNALPCDRIRFLASGEAAFAERLERAVRCGTMDCLEVRLKP